MKFTILFSLFLSMNSFANTGAQCGQANTSFVDLIRTYKSCNDPISGNQMDCDRFCSDASKLLGQDNRGSCDQVVILKREENARRDGIEQGKQQGRNEVIKDLSVREDFISRTFYGSNEKDCSDRVSRASQDLRNIAINNCNNKAVAIKNCFIKTEKLSSSAGAPPIFEGASTFKRNDNESTEDVCRSTALADAKVMALKNCAEATGSNCVVNDSQTIVTHRLEKPFIRLGRRDQRICDAKVVVNAAADIGISCNLRISARNQITAE